MTINLLPVNLANMGVPRRAPEGEADLVTPALTPYPMVTNYLLLCKACPNILTPFGGGTIEQQGTRINGFITSGYRNELVNERVASPHRFAMAWDIIVMAAVDQITVGRRAVDNDLFTRVGFYPDRHFIHVDMVPDNWIEHYRAARSWVEMGGKQFYFNDISSAIELVFDWEASN
jgi:hypothetical protein